MENASTLSPAKQAVLQQRLKRASDRSSRRVEIPKRPSPRSAPLSFAQSQMWVIDQMTPGNPAYNLPYGFRLRGALDIAALQYGFNEIVKRHETLRTTFDSKNGEPRQWIHPELRIAIRVATLESLAPERRERRLHALASEESIQSFDLARLPLIRVSLFKLDEGDHVLIVTMHHSVGDGMSVGLLMKELDVFYRRFTEGRGEDPPELAVQYGDYAHWQRQTIANEPSVAGQMDFWRTRLGGTLPVLELPCDKSRPALQSFNGANVFFDVPAALARELTVLGAREGCTLFMTVLAAFQALLHRYSGAEEMVIGTPVSARTRAEIEPLIGNFLNLAALRCDVSGDPTFLELLRRSRDTALSAFSNGDLPFESMIKRLKFERDPSRNPIFQVLLQVLPAAPQRIGDLETDGFFFDMKFAQFDLSLHLYQNAGGYTGRFEYCSDLFEAQTVRRLCNHFVALLEGIVREPARRVSMLPMLSDSERHQLLSEWNSPSPEQDRNDRCLHQMIEEQASRTPERVAAAFERRTLTYGELNRRANQLAHHLRRLGAGPDRTVAVLVERSLEMLVGILGILKAGAAYAPIDPDYPKERIGCILEDAKARIVLTRKSLLESLPDFAGQTLCLDRDSAEIAGASEENPVTAVRPENLAYVLFTSGSTGQPKGVALEHRSAVAFVRWARQVFTPRELAGVLFSTSLCFDLSVFEIFVALSGGGKVIVARNALHLAELPQKDEVTLINTVPSAIAELLRMNAVPASVKIVNLAGETLPAALVERIYSNTGCEKVYNLYGPTEATTYSTYTWVRRGRPVTIGRPIAGTQCLILDSHRQLVPIGVPGELYLAGDGLARGYCGRPELTSERFVPNPFGKDPQARMYRTGDVCRRLPDGNIQHLGRSDHQVKLRGFRIELGEIEQVLLREGGVREAAAIVGEVGDGDKRLIAYYVPSSPASTAATLRKILQSKLPGYMVPSCFVALDQFPLTPNGKLDRNALPIPGAGDEPPRGAAVAPRTPTEAVVAHAFRAVLDREDIGIFDDFFELGGHSLMAARLMSTLRTATGADLSLRDLFTRPTVAGLAEAIDAMQWLQASSPAAGRAAVREEIIL